MKSKSERIMEIIEKHVGNAYEIGHCHGMNAYRVYVGQKDRRSEEGWGQYSEMLYRELIDVIGEKSSRNE